MPAVAERKASEIQFRLHFVIPNAVVFVKMCELNYIIMVAFKYFDPFDLHSMKYFAEKLLAEKLGFEIFFDTLQ